MQDKSNVCVQFICLYLEEIDKLSLLTVFIGWSSQLSYISTALQITVIVTCIAAGRSNCEAAAPDTEGT